MQQSNFTGGRKGNKLVAGPVYQSPATSGKYGGTAAYGGGGQNYNNESIVNQASAIAEYDFGVDEEQKEIKFEKISHACAASVANARLAAKMTQTQLATKCNEKPHTIVAIENGTANYSADIINRIERALGVKLNRARNRV